MRCCLGCETHQQRLMEAFAQVLAIEHVYIYLDNILILSESFKKHLINFTVVFYRLRIFNLHARRRKCICYIITANGFYPDPNKVTAITQMKKPFRKIHISSFIQNCSCFRKFIPGFSEVARSFTCHLKKCAKFKFGDKKRVAFEFSKKKLSTALILCQTDASGYAFGAVLWKVMPTMKSR